LPYLVSSGFFLTAFLLCYVSLVVVKGDLAVFCLVSFLTDYWWVKAAGSSSSPIRTDSPAVSLYSGAGDIKDWHMLTDGL
jgi:hypothetical protein